MNWELITKQVVNLLRGLGTFLVERGDIPMNEQHIKNKGTHDFVTDTDLKMEEVLVQELTRILPEAGFIAEEGQGYKKGEVYNWIIDPLDGTTNFIHYLPFYAISVALMEGDEVVLGVIYEPGRREAFYAWWGGPAFLNDNVIQVSKKKKLADCLLATGFPYEDFSRFDNYIAMLRFLMKNTHGVRRLGSAALDLAYVASGRFDGFFEYGLKPWDVAAGVAIVRSAGGRIADFSGGEDYIFGNDIIASGLEVYDEFLGKIMENFSSQY